jgi:Tfp pilus assembly ATPase PilU
MHKLLAAMSQAGGSDLFIANDFPAQHESQRAACSRCQANV